MEQLITIKQLPILEERFIELGKEIDLKLAHVKNLVVNEENYKDVKNIRALFNKDSKSYADEFKKAEAMILEPWKKAKDTYVSNVVNPYKNADIELKEKINYIEKGLKWEKEVQVKDFFEKHRVSKELDFIRYEDADITVTLSASLKSLKDKAKAFLDEIEEDLKLIATQEGAEEILVEYKRSLNVSKSITDVTARRKAIEEEKIKAEEIKAKKLAEKERKKALEKALAEANPVIEPITPPVAETVVELPKVAENMIVNTPVVEAPAQTQKEMFVAFKVYGNLDKLKELSRFLKENNYNYEQIKG